HNGIRFAVSRLTASTSRTTFDLGVRRHDAAFDGETRLAAPSALMSCEYPRVFQMQAGRRAAPSKAAAGPRPPRVVTPGAGDLQAGERFWRSGCHREHEAAAAGLDFWRDTPAELEVQVQAGALQEFGDRRCIRSTHPKREGVGGAGVVGNP